MQKICSRPNQNSASPKCRIYKKYAKNMHHMQWNMPNMQKICKKYAKNIFLKISYAKWNLTHLLSRTFNKKKVVLSLDDLDSQDSPRSCASHASRSKCYFKGLRKKNPLIVSNLILKTWLNLQCKGFLLSQCDVEKYFGFIIVGNKIYLKVIYYFLASL